MVDFNLGKSEPFFDLEPYKKDLLEIVNGLQEIYSIKYDELGNRVLSISEDYDPLKTVAHLQNAHRLGSLAMIAQRLFDIARDIEKLNASCNT